MIIIDLDHFKRLNDAHGHAAGDAVLRHVGQRLAASVRSVDVAGRYGGEEFLVVLPETGAGRRRVARREAAARRRRQPRSGCPTASSSA